MEQTSDPSRVIPTRRISFDTSLEGMPKYFAHDGDLIESHLTASLSAMFPDGEDFFVRSVRHYRSKITDPILKQQVNGFIGQEAMHGREHRELNDHFAALGYPTKRVEKLVRISLELRSKIVPPIANLAMTAALEHFTATMAESMMTESTREDGTGHQGVANLFLWHALEESEHKAVAFDVYRAVGGGERLRVWTMKFLRPGFVFFTALNVIISLLGDPGARKRGAVRRSWKHFKQSPLAGEALYRQLRDYDRPDFHPNDQDTTALEAELRAKLFGDSGSLNELLVSAPTAA